MNRVVHFEIQADDTKRAIKFYQQVFSWEIKRWEDGAGGKILQPAMKIEKVGTFAMCQDTEGNMFGLMQSEPGAMM